MMYDVDVHVHDYDITMKAYSQLADEESRQWFDAHAQYAMKRFCFMMGVYP